MRIPISEGDNIDSYIPISQLEFHKTSINIKEAYYLDARTQGYTIEEILKGKNVEDFTSFSCLFRCSMSSVLFRSLQKKEGKSTKVGDFHIYVDIIDTDLIDGRINPTSEFRYETADIFLCISTKSLVGECYYTDYKNIITSANISRDAQSSSFDRGNIIKDGTDLYAVLGNGYVLTEDNLCLNSGRIVVRVEYRTIPNNHYEVPYRSFATTQPKGTVIVKDAALYLSGLKPIPNYVKNVQHNKMRTILIE